MSDPVDLEELKARLQELIDRPTPQTPWGFRWMDKLSEPSNPWPLRVICAAAVACYVLGFAASGTWFVFAFSLMFMVWPMSEDRAKHNRERRQERRRVEMETWEKNVRNVWQVARFERQITPDWML